MDYPDNIDPRLPRATPAPRTSWRRRLAVLAVVAAVHAVAAAGRYAEQRADQSVVRVRSDAEVRAALDRSFDSPEMRALLDDAADGHYEGLGEGLGEAPYDK